MDYTYYIEINVFCIAVLTLLHINLPKMQIMKVDQKLYRLEVVGAIIYCISDLITWILMGSVNPFVKVVEHIGYVLFFLSSVYICYIWFLYIVVKIDGNTVRMKSWAIPAALPAIVFTVVVLSSPFTHSVYLIDANGMYQRGPEIIIHWIACFIYPIVGLVFSLYNVKTEKSKLRRREIIYPLCLFPVFPTLGAVLQIANYGTALIQVGFVLSILIIFVRQQNAQISIDTLTNVNNRHQFDRYLDERLAVLRSDDSILLVMIDLNHFKSINDTFGHVMGDQMLVDFASVLKKVCGQMERGLFLSRYGGDEFVIVSCGKNIIDAASLMSVINEAVEEYNNSEEKAVPQDISISMGHVEGKVIDFKSTDQLVRIADSRMYKNKEIYRLTHK